MGLTPDQMADTVLETYYDLAKDKWIGEMTDIQRFVGFNEIIKGKKEQQDHGLGITVRYVTSDNGSSQFTGLFNKVQYNRDSSVVEGTVPWRYQDGNMVFDRRENAMNGGAEQIFDLVEKENARMMMSIAEDAEAATWGVPTDSNDNETPWGIEYWLTKSATLGFNGGNPTGFSAGRAGVSSVTYTRHQNFTGGYTTVDDQASTGLIYQMEYAADQTNFVAPSPEPGMGRTGYSRRIFTNWATMYAMKNLAKSNNDSLGFDLATKSPMFRGASIVSVPYLTNNSTDNSLYMIDFNHFYAKFLKNWYMERTRVDQLPDQPHSFAIVVSLVYNFCCDELRNQSVFYDTTA